MASTRASSLLIACLLAVPLLAPAPAQARAWQGLEPGKTTADEVVAKLGEPTTRVKRGARSVLDYKGEGAPSGAKEAQFHCRGDGVVEEITVFLANPLDAESIEGEFGKPEKKTFTDTFQKVWQYPRKGVTVYFDKEGAVEAISYAAAAPAPKGAPADAKTP
jgi:outer membrane protein assembly factor BamE (lipoprotein component of BamABCDE complex)